MTETNPPSSHEQNFSAESATWFLVGLWTVLSLGWIGGDRMVPDGDEQGHIGAAELFLSDLQASDPMGFFSRLWWDQMGEYPQAFTAGAGLWWWLMDGGQPGRAAVRAICLLSLVIAAVATGRICRRYAAAERRGLAQTTGTLLVLCMPLGNGLTRHFMPEGALIAAVAVAILAAHRLVERPGIARGVQLGVLIGLGVLTKQTFVLLAALPLIWVLLRLRRDALIPVVATLCASAATAAPWILHNSGDQLVYGLSSWGGHGDAGLWTHAAYYPTTALSLGLGPVLAVAAIVSVVLLARTRDKRALLLGAMWLLGGLVIITLIPKKYPRLMAPLLPGAAIWISVALSRARSPIRWILPTGGLAAAWVVLASTTTIPFDVAPASVDPGCPQVWLRPPDKRDLGLESTARALNDMPDGSVLVLGAPAIPCDVQTTHDWVEHLRPYLRRNGVERTVHDDIEQPYAALIDWTGGPGIRIEAPALATSFTVRATLAP